MKYNEKYDRWISKDGLVYRYDTKQDKLILCKQTEGSKGYFTFRSKHKLWRVHRAVYETFCGEIPAGFEIDHIDTVRTNNSLENLRIVTHKDNLNNPLTKIHRINAHKGQIVTEEQKLKRSSALTDKPRSVFGKKYLEHYGYGRKKDIKQYKMEHRYFMRYGKCSWE